MPLIKGAIAHRGAAFIDVDQPVRRVQQPRRQHQELRLRARAQRGGEPARLHAARATRSRVEYAPGEVIEVHAARRQRAAPAQARRRLRRRRPHRRDEPHRRSTRRAARSSPGCCTSTREPSDLHAHLNTVDGAVQPARRRASCAPARRRSRRSTPSWSERRRAAPRQSTDSEATKGASGRFARRLLALVLLQVALADADRLRRDLDQLVVGDELDRVFERQLDRRRDLDRVFLAGDAEVGQLLAAHALTTRSLSREWMPMIMPSYSGSPALTNMRPRSSSLPSA